MREEKKKRREGRGENMDISVSLFIVLGYLITMTGGKRARPGPAICVLACAKNLQDKDVDRRWWRGFLYSLREDRATQ